jgi:outer membrane lipoprotein-sorting protein
MKRMAKTAGLFLMGIILLATQAYAQNADALVKKVKAKLDKVTDYQAEGKLKTDVSFIKIPLSNVKVYYKSPNRFKIKKDGGISILPKGGVSINMSTLLTLDKFTAIETGTEDIGGVATKVVQLIPLSKSDLRIATLYIDEKNLLIRKTNVTTTENGSYVMEMSYGKYAAWSLPDKVIFSFDTKDYKLPKGVTLEVQSGNKKTEDKLKNKTGRVEISYSSYTINKGVDDSLFK